MPHNTAGVPAAAAAVRGLHADHGGALPSRLPTDPTPPNILHTLPLHGEPPPPQARARAQTGIPRVGGEV